MASSINSRAGAKPKKPAANKPPPERKVTSRDNIEAVEEAEKAQALSIANLVIAKKREQAKIKAELDAVNKDINVIYADAKKVGWLRKDMEEIVRDLTAGGLRRDQRKEEALRAKRRRWFGLPVADEEEQLELLPEEKKDEFDWRSEGYRLGYIGEPAVLPKGLPPRMDQPFLEGHASGSRDATTEMAKNAPKPLGTAKAEAAAVREQAAADFKSDNPDVKVAEELDETPDQRRAREKEEAKRALKGLDKLQPPPEEMAAGVIHEPGTAGIEEPTAIDDLPPAAEVEGQAAEDDGFEMSEEELAAQAGRPSTEEAAEEPGEAFE